MSWRPVAVTARPLYAGGGDSGSKNIQRVWDGFQTGPEPALGKGLALPQYWKVFEYSFLKKRREALGYFNFIETVSFERSLFGVPARESLGCRSGGLGVPCGRDMMRTTRWAEVKHILRPGASCL
jgi:hypothetical protein